MTLTDISTTRAEVDMTLMMTSAQVVETSVNMSPQTVIRTTQTGTIILYPLTISPLASNHLQFQVNLLSIKLFEN